MEKWYKKVYRRHLLDMHINDDKDIYLSRFNEYEYFNNLKRAKIQSPMIYLQSHTGLCNFPSKVAKTHNNMQGENNRLKRLINLCKEDGMKVVGYYSLIFNNVATDKHGEWEMVDASNKTFRDNGFRYGLCCPNNQEYRKFLAENVKEMGEYFTNLDGIFYDMPYWEVTCHCDACKKRFLEETGLELPNENNFTDSTWLLYQKKRQDWMAEFARFVRELSLKVMPHTTCELNYAAVIAHTWIGACVEGVNECSEFAGGDLYGDLYNHSFTAKYYYTITKNQPFEYMTCRCDKRLREHTISKPQHTLETEIALTMAHHGATLIIDAINPDGSMDERVYESVGKAYEKQIPYEEYFDKGSLYSDVAVYFDSRTQFNSENANAFNKTCCISAHKTLIENHICTSVVANTKLDNLNSNQMVIAPCLQDFDNDEPLKLIDYVKNGGVLYLSGKSDKRLIKEFFGGEFVGYSYGEKDFDYLSKVDRVRAYISPKEEYEYLFDGFNKEYPLPLVYSLPLFENIKGEVLGVINLPYTNPSDSKHFASIHSNPPAYQTEYPAIVKTNYGKGTVIWTIATIENDEREGFKNVFMNIVNSFVKPKYNISTNKFVESVVFEDKEKTYISFVDINCYGDLEERKFSIELKENQTIKSINEDIKINIKNNIATGKFKKFCMLEIS